MNKPGRILLILSISFSAMTVFFACHLNGNSETEETFTFPTLRDSVKTADSVLIVLKAPNGQVIDTLYHDKLTSITSFVDLKAPHYTGGAVLIFIEASKDGKLIYKVERGFDPAQGGDIPDTRVVYVSPSLGLRLDRTLTKLRAGDTVSLPGYSVSPPTLQDKSILWTSRNPAIFKVENGNLMALIPGTAHLVAALAVDTTKKDSLSIEVVTRTEPIASIDSLILVEDTLTLVLGGPTGRFTLRAVPASASLEANWSLVSGSSVQLASNGLLTAVAEGFSRIAAVSKVDTTVSDTAVVQVRTVAARVVQITTPKDGAYVNTTPISVTWTVDGQGQSDSQVLTAGSNTITRSAKDSVGKNFSHSILVYLDQTAPNPPTVKGSTVPVNTLTPKWSWSSGGNGGNGSFRMRLDDPNLSTSAATQDTFHIPAANLDTGTHILYVQERDEAGNWSASGSATIVIDTARPAPPTVSGPALTNDSTPTWTWTTATPGTVQFRYRLDTANLATGATSTTQKEFTPASHLTEGIHTLYVQERDAAGNWSNSGSLAIRLDLTKPTEPRIDSTPYSPLNSLRPKFTWRNGTGGAKVFRARIDNSDLSVVAEKTDSSFTPGTDLQEGLRTLYVQERDSAGNWSPIATRSIYLAKEGILGSGPASTGPAIGGEMACTKAGLLFITYTEDGPDSTVAVRYFQNGIWKNPGQTGRKSGSKPSIEIDSRDNIYLGSVWTSFGTASILRFDGANWNEYVQAFNDWGGNLNLAIDGLDSLYLSYAFSRDCFVKKLRNFQWDTLGGVIYPPSPGDFQTAFAVSGSGQAYFALEVSNHLNVFKFIEPSWENAGDPGFGISWPYSLSMVTLKSGEPIITAQGLDNKLSVSKLKNGAWQVVGNAGFSEGLVSRTALASSPSGDPYIAYFETVLGVQRLVVAKLVNSSWEKVGAPYPTPLSDHLSLIVDALGIPYVSFQDGNKGGAITVLRKSFDQN